MQLGIRSLAAASAAALGLLVGAGGARADGNAVVESKSLPRSEVMLGKTTFQVRDATVIEDANGHRITLREVPAMDEGASGDAAAVWYETAGDAGGTPVLHLLKLTGGMPK
jgi:hypothetical protein